MFTSPSCQCCGCVSETHLFATSGLTGWTQQSGAWTIDGTGHATTSDDYAILLRDSAPTWSYNFSIVTWDDTGGGFGTAGYGLRVFFGWVDASNYWYVTAVDTGLNTRNVKLVQVVAGVENVILQETNSWNPSPVWHVCYQNGRLTLLDRNSTSPWLSIVVSIAQGKIGIGSTTPTIKVSTFEYVYNPSGERVCDECLNGSCCDGYAVAESLSVVISGLPSPYHVWNGAYTVPKYDASSDDPPACVWQKTNALANLGGGYVANYLRVMRYRNAGILRSSVELYYEKPSGQIITLGSDVIVSGPWTISPCHDQWNTPRVLTGSDTIVSLSGQVDEITGNF